MIKQTESPVVPVISIDKLRTLLPEMAVGMLNQREELIERMSKDPFQHTHDPERWRRIDLEVARKRLKYPGTVIELIVMGGNDSGKTHGGVLRLVRHFFHTHKAWCWGLHSTEASSKEIHQQRVYDLSPLDLRDSLNEKGGAKARRNVSLKFQEGKGFTDNRFTYHRSVTFPGRDKPTDCGGVMSFKFFESKTKNLQGSKLTAASSDELVDADMAKTVKQRMVPRARDTARAEFLHEIEEIVKVLETGRQLTAYQQGLLYTSVHIMGFTPMEGYSAFVAGVLDSAVTIEEESAEVIVPFDAEVPDCFPCLPLGAGTPRKRVMLLPLRNKHGQVVGSKKVPVFKQPSKPTQIVAYLPTHANPWTNIPGKLLEMVGENEEYIRKTYFGDVEKNWSSAFPKFRAAQMPLGHVVDTPDVPQYGTWYHFADFANQRNFFMGWVMVDPQGRKWVMREWPQEGDYIPEDDWGDPGAWAITSKSGKRDGDPGPAQPDRGLGLAAYKREMERIEAEIGAWWSAGGQPIEIEQRQGDSRLGNNPTRTEAGTTSIIDEFEAVEVLFDSMSGRCLSDGNKLINDGLDYDRNKPMGPRNSPQLFIHKQCKAIIWALSNYSGADGQKAACKDPRDVVASMMLGDLQYVGDGRYIVKRGRVPYG